MIGVTVSQTTSLIVAITGLIAAIGSVVAAVLGTLNRRSLKTPSGPSIGTQVERAHLTGIANNMLLSKQNGPTKPLDPHTVEEDAASQPQVPDTES